MKVIPAFNQTAVDHIEIYFKTNYIFVQKKYNILPPSIL